MDKTRLVITENHREYVTVVEAQGLEVQQVQVSAEGAHKRPSTQNFLQNSQQQLVKVTNPCRIRFGRIVGVVLSFSVQIFFTFDSLALWGCLQKHFLFSLIFLQLNFCLFQTSKSSSLWLLVSPNRRIPVKSGRGWTHWTAAWSSSNPLSNAWSNASKSCRWSLGKK